MEQNEWCPGWMALRTKDARMRGISICTLFLIFFCNKNTPLVQSMGTTITVCPRRHLHGQAPYFFHQPSKCQITLGNIDIFFSYQCVLQTKQHTFPCRYTDNSPTCIRWVGSAICTTSQSRWHTCHPGCGSDGGSCLFWPAWLSSDRAFSRCVVEVTLGPHPWRIRWTRWRPW